MPLATRGSAILPLARNGEELEAFSEFYLLSAYGMCHEPQEPLCVPPKGPLECQPGQPFFSPLRPSRSVSSSVSATPGLPTSPFSTLLLS